MELYEQLVTTITRMGYPVELGCTIADQLRTERAMRRMLGYLRQAKPKRIEEIADELVAILGDRDNWTKKKIAEHANAKYNAYLNSEFRE